MPIQPTFGNWRSTCNGPIAALGSIRAVRGCRRAAFLLRALPLGGARRRLREDARGRDDAPDGLSLSHVAVRLAHAQGPLRRPRSREPDACDSARDRDGTFAREWSAAGSEGAEMLARVKALRDQLPLTDWEERSRRAFRIGEITGPS